MDYAKNISYHPLQKTILTISLLIQTLNQYLGPSELEILMAHVTIVSFSQGEVILQQGQHSTGIYIIIEGVVNLTQLITTAKNCVLIKEGVNNSDCYIVIRGGVQSSIIHHKKVAKFSVLGPITVFCSTSNIDRAASSSVNFSTCEPSILLRFSETALATLQHEHMKLWAKLFDLICKSLIAMERSFQKLNIRLNIELYNR